MTEKIVLDFWGKTPSFKRKIMQNVIIDRGSKYTAVGWFVDSKDMVSLFVKEIKKDKYFVEATHNSYAYRIKLDNQVIVEGKNDDWEEGAWNCILRELQRENAINTIVIVTRVFWWKLLYSDRFKNVIEASKIILKEI